MNLKRIQIRIFLFLAGMAALLPALSQADTITQEIEIYTAATSHDATEERGTVDLYENYLSLDKDTYVAIRFQSVSVPQGAVIENAYLEFTAYADANKDDNSDRGPGISRYIYGEDTDDADAFTSTRESISDRYDDRTNNRVNWNNLPQWTAGSTYQTSDIKDVVQEIIGRTGWSSGNDMAFFIRVDGNSKRYVRSYDYADLYSTTDMPMLYIKYSTEEDTSDDPSYIDISDTTLGETCYIGYDADSSTFTITNSGAGEMNFTLSDDADWLTLSDTSGTLASGESTTITVTYDTDAKDADTYEATITITDSGATNSPVEIAVSVTVMEEEEDSCDHIPLYAEDIVSPSILILLDVSGSMDTMMDVYEEENPQTPDLSSIVEEIVGRTGWTSGNDMAFIITGSGNRRAVSYDGDSGSAPILHVEYNDGSDDIVLDISVKASSDDAIEDGDGHMYLTDTILAMVDDDTSQSVGLRFQDVDIPNGATIDAAYIEFTISQSDDGDTDLTIHGEDSDNASTFEGGKDRGTWTGDDNISDRTLTTASVSWSDVDEWAGATQKSRLEIGKSAIGNLVEDRDIYWGYGTWSGSGQTSSRSGPGGTTTISSSEYSEDEDYTIVHVGCKENTDDQQTALQEAIEATETHAYTPFEPSLIAGKEYFIQNKADELGDYYESNDCQSLILIDVTDGLGNLWSTEISSSLNDTQTEAAELALIETAVTNLATNNISTVTVGFGIDDATQINAAAALANSLGNADDDDKLYALHEEEDDGSGNMVGVPFLANNETELTTALSSITSAVKDNLFHGAAPAPTTTADLGNMLLVATFDAGEWSGDLKALVEDDDGNWDVVDWIASDAMPGTRNFFTVETDASGDVSLTTYSDFVSTYHSCKVLGDIINSTPVVINDPSYYYNFDGYRSWAKSVERDSMVYIGANDGALHAFSLADGEEQWAFVPESLQEKLNLGLTEDIYDMCSDEYCHQFFVDGSPQAADTYIQLDSESAPSWKTILVTGLGEGGEAYFALDVTSGNALDDSSDPSAFMWEFTDDDLGLALIEPSIERVNNSGTDTVWAVFFGSGYAASSSEQDLKEAYLYGILAANTSDLWNDGTDDINKIKIQDGLQDDALASPLVAEMDDDYIADCIYVGNLYGTMFRVSDIGFAETPQVTTLLDLGNTENDINPIRAKAAYAYSDTLGDIWVYWGTGIYEEQSDKTNMEQQYFFGVKDSLGSTSTTSMSDMAGLGISYTDDTYTDTDGNTVTTTYRYITGDNEDGDSWYITLDSTSTGLTGSERVLKSGYVSGGVLFFTTFIPAEDLCSGAGEAWLFAVDFETGEATDEPVFDINGDGEINDDDVLIDADGNTIYISGISLSNDDESSGIASDVVLNGDTELLVNTTSGGLQPIDVNLPGLSITLESWQHVF
jgi:type IV pilus assembly protein PilY1